MVNKGYSVISKQPRRQGKFTAIENEAMKNLTVRLPVPTIQWLEKEATRKGLTKTDVVRGIFKELIEAKKR